MSQLHDPATPRIDAPRTVREFLIARAWISPDERIVRCTPAGDGNMNLTVRVQLDSRSVVLKQARPWVEKYPQIPAPVERTRYEQRFYQRVRELREVAQRMPALLAADHDACALLMEDIGEARDMTDVYGGAVITPFELRELAQYLRALHCGTQGTPDSTLANPDIRALNHEHIYALPYRADNGLELDTIEPGLRKAADALAADPAVRSAASEMGRRYLADGDCLVHGDYFPGSWLRAEDGIRVIDTEFCYFGEREFDIGNALAHFVLAGQGDEAARSFLDDYAQAGGAFDAGLVVRYAACEIIRRLIGVAQLPISRTSGWRAELLTRARRSLLSGAPDALWGHLTRKERDIP